MQARHATPHPPHRERSDGECRDCAKKGRSPERPQCEYIGADEYVEATPKSLRLRKRILDATARKRAANAAAA